MKNARQFAIVLVTAPGMTHARRLARLALKEQLIACANLVPSLESHYRWKGRLERSKEVLMVLKTRRNRLAALEQLILKHHPYETPEFVVLPLTAGSMAYLKWLRANC